MFGLNEIWFLLLIPLLATLYLLGWHKNATKWWELLVVWGVAIIAILISQWSVEKLLVSDVEDWGYNGVKSYYNEPFQYWTTCTRVYACGQSCDSKGHCTTNWCTEFYPCKEWAGDDAYLIDQNNGKRRISKARFKKLETDQWNNTRTQDMERHKHYDIVVDGDRRWTKWPGTWQTAEPIAERHTYENRTIHSTSIKFPHITDEDVKTYNLFEYPDYYGGYEVQTIMDQSKKYWRKADQRWRYVNGMLGPRKRVRLWVLIFRDQTREAFYKQQGYWYNGNKNEFIICIGADKAGNIKWGEVMSWTEVEDLKIEFRNYVSTEMKVVDDNSLLALAAKAEVEVGKRYIKPDFKEKFGHLAVAPTKSMMAVTAFIISLVTGGICWWVVKNDFHDRPRGGTKKNKRRRR